MNSLFAGIHIKNKTNEFLSLDNIDFEKNISYLKQEIANKLQYDPNNLEIIYNGIALQDDVKLDGTVRPNGTIHCFQKTEKYTSYEPVADSINSNAAQELFNVIAHIQLNVKSRVNILQKILAEYPEFRRNLGAQAMIRDSVLFNTLHQPKVIKKVAQHYPIICEAAPYIVDVVKKELTRNTSTSNYSEPATDSTNSSEEENSLGANSSGERVGEDASGAQSENARIRVITRQQLQAALEQVGMGTSANSLSNIAQRNADSTATGSAPLSTSASGERISSEMFRNELQRVFDSLGANAPTQMEVSDTPASDDSSANTTQGALDESSGDIPAYYRTHQYAEQLRTMAQMGFVNYDENLTYLNITNGNIENAITLLVGSMN